MKWQIRLRKRFLLRHDSRWNAWVRDFTAWLERPYWPFTKWKRWPYGYPFMDGEMIVIGPQCFADARDESVISWKGENYYRDSSELQRTELEEDLDNGV